jgi:hypothetical protein
MLIKRLLAILLLVTAFCLPESVWSQANDSAKGPSPITAPQLIPSHRPADTASAASAAVASSIPAVPSGPDTDTIFSPNDWMVIETHHRMFPDFLQLDTVKPKERFQIGEDGPYGEVVRFVADLKVTMKGERAKMSDTLYNPAVLVRVYVPDTVTHQDSVIQETWAFLYGSSPHFSRQSFFAFLLRDFKVENPKYVKPPVGE